MTETVDFTRANNQDWEAEFTLINDEASPPIVHVIPQSKILLQLRPSPGSSDLIINAVLRPAFDETQPVNLTVVDSAAAKVKLSVRASKMRQIKDGAYVYDIILVRPTGRSYRPVSGKLTLYQGVTELPT